MNTNAFESRTAGALPLLQHISTAIGLVETIDQLVPWDPVRCRLSPGRRIEALVLNILAGRTPLYRVGEFYEDTATELVFGPGITAEQLSDDCLARALDKLAAAGPRAVYSADFGSFALKPRGGIVPSLPSPHDMWRASDKATTACAIMVRQQLPRRTIPLLLAGPCGRRVAPDCAVNEPKSDSAVALRACLFEGIDRTFLHFDTTSMSLFGEYPDNQPGELQLRRGYSKDSHPELKQLVLSLLCNRQGIPIWSEARDGNSEDTHANHDAIDRFCAALSPQQLRETVYTADSKLVCEANLESMSSLGLRFLSHLPESFAVSSIAKRAALQSDQWQDLGQLAKQPRPTGARYRASEQRGVIGNRTYRLLVVHSDHLATRKRLTFAKHLERKRESLLKEAQALAAQHFEHAEDALRAVTALRARTKGGLFPVSAQIQEHQRPLPRAKRGRPRKDEPVCTVPEFRVAATVGNPDPERLAAEEQTHGLFVLITNLEDQESFPARRLLEEYRDQSAVEQRFAFLKDPVFIDGLFLHTPRRIEALAYVFVMACLLYSVFERRVRLRLQAAQSQIQLPGKRWTNNPTGKMLLAMVGGLSVGRHGADPWTLSSPPHMTERAARVTRLAGFDLHALYTAPDDPATNARV